MQSPNIRTPAVAGQFYPDDPQTLSREVAACLALDALSGKEKRAGVVGCVVPHAGYMYSGRVAGAVYRLLPLCPRYIILGPNHRGRGAPLAMMSSGKWLTPLGASPVDAELGSALQQALDPLAEDAYAHAAEHSLEVQLPFLQRLTEEFSFLPVAIGMVNFVTLELLGHALAYVISGSKEAVLIIASSDMNHYEPDAVTRKKDHLAIEKILALDPAGLLDVLRRENISMCGYGPVIAMLTAAKDLGAQRGELIKYATSADASGDRSSVVGYAGAVIL